MPNGSGMRSESKAVAELLNLSPRLSSLAGACGLGLSLCCRLKMESGRVDFV